MGVQAEARPWTEMDFGHGKGADAVVLGGDSLKKAGEWGARMGDGDVQHGHQMETIWRRTELRHRCSLQMRPPTSTARPGQQRRSRRGQQRRSRKAGGGDGGRSQARQCVMLRFAKRDNLFTICAAVNPSSTSTDQPIINQSQTRNHNHTDLCLFGCI
jgi:hypothetical protein